MTGTDTHHEPAMNRSIDLSVQLRRQAVRLALLHIVNGAPHLGLAELIASVHKCAHLDNRPLSPERVVFRANQLVRRWRGAA